MIEGYEFYGEVLLLGDNSKYKFLSSFLKEELENIQDIFIEVINGRIFEKIQTVDRMIIKSPVVPKRKKLYLCNHIYDILMNFQKVDKVILFTSFPYEKQTIIDECNSLKNEIEISDFQVVIYNECRDFSSTDLTKEEDSINNLIDYLNKMCFKYIILNSFKEIDYILNVTPNLLNSFKSNFKGNIERTKEKFIGDFNKDYDFNIINYFTKLSILYPKEYEKYNNMFNYNRVKVFNDIWDGYVVIFSKEYIYGEGGIIEIAVEFYENYIKNICFWDLQEELTELGSLIVKEYNQYFSCYKKYPMVSSELEYIIFLNKEQSVSLKLLFKKRVHGFIDKVLRNILKAKIDNTIKGIEVKKEECI